MADSRIKSASDLVAAFFDAETRAKGERIAGFWSSWAGIAGSRLAQHSAPVDIRHGILIVEAEHQGWIQLLLFQQEKILRLIGEKYPELEIKGLAFRLGSSNQGSANPGALIRGEPVEAPESRAPREAKASVHEEHGGVKAAASADAVRGAGAGSLPPELAEAFLRLREKSKR